jgi:hypothetical protein
VKNEKQSDKSRPCSSFLAPFVGFLFPLSYLVDFFARISQTDEKQPLVVESHAESDSKEIQSPKEHDVSLGTGSGFADCTHFSAALAHFYPFHLMMLLVLSLSLLLVQIVFSWFDGSLLT